MKEARNQLDRDCPNCPKITFELEATLKELSELRKTHSETCEDVEMLKNVVYRLNVQLERYQQKLNKYNLKVHFKECQVLENCQTVSSEVFLKSGRSVRGGDVSKEENAKFEGIPEQGGVLSEEHWNHSHTPISWGKVNAHTLGPLLDAYQETISEKEEIIKDYEEAFGKFSDRVREVIRENEVLHKELTEDGECSKVLKVKIEGLNGEVESLKVQNDLLIKKCALKQEKVEEVLRCYEQKVELVRRDYGVLQSQYAKCQNEVAVLREKNKSLVEAQDDFKNERQQYIPVSVHKTSVEECRK